MIRPPFILQATLLWLPAALAVFVAFTDRKPANPLSRDYPTMCEAENLMRSERYGEASQRYRAITEQEPRNGMAWYLYACCLHAAGEFDRALPIHHKAHEFRALRAESAYNIACVFALRDEKERAFQWLDRAWEAGFQDDRHMRADEDLASLRDDPRFARYATSPAPSTPLMTSRG